MMNVDQGLTPDALLVAYPEACEGNKAPFEYKTQYPFRCPSNQPYWLKSRPYFRKGTG